MQASPVTLHIMRTNIEIDDTLLEAAMRSGPYDTKQQAVHAGLELLARRAAYREVLKWRGKLRWEGDESIDWTASPPTEEAADEAHAESLRAGR